MNTAVSNTLHSQDYLTQAQQHIDLPTSTLSFDPIDANNCHFTDTHEHTITLHSHISLARVSTAQRVSDRRVLQALRERRCLRRVFSVWIWRKVLREHVAEQSVVDGLSGGDFGVVVYRGVEELIGVIGLWWMSLVIVLDEVIGFDEEEYIVGLYNGGLVDYVGVFKVCHRLVPSCFAIFTFKPLTLSLTSMPSCDLVSLTNILILCLILKASNQSLRKSLSLNLELS
ncbi:hypothetical protein Tco_0976182 [Tanacetum coccineum]|uniref:Uncharacterized protein n=1 Tax=Tanacetum coccineum TaxID=301880 RepID=A0ABQ5EGI0_9ASTR